MAKIKSVFGAYSENLQAMFDVALPAMVSPWFQNYFDWGVPKATLDFTTVIGRARIEAMASVIDRDSSAPLRSRAGIELLKGAVPVIKEKFKLTEDDYRQWLMIQSMRGISDATKLNQILDLIWGDAKKAAEAPIRRLDAMVLEGISTGQITINATNNPDGIVTAAIPLGLPTSNVKTASVTWATASSAKPITDIESVIEEADKQGRQIAKILMTKTKFWQMIKTQEVIDVLKGYFNYATKNIPTMSQVSQYFADRGFPPIEIVDWATGIEKDGKISTYRPFKEEHLAFLPAGRIGVIHNALAMEEISPVEQVNYAKVNRVLVSKWGENDPFAEFTMGELNAFPGFEAIDSIFLLNTIPG